MANSSAHRIQDSAKPAPLGHQLVGAGPSGVQLRPTTNHLRHSQGHQSAASLANVSSSSSPGSSSKGHQVANYRSHQRRQSVARLLPDISKLRLLSWLVEASSELINCDIAIMDGVYAKLNRSQESLLFWSNTNTNQRSFDHLKLRQQQPQIQAQPTSSLTSALFASGRRQVKQQQQQQRQSPQRPQPPSSQPVANNLVISQRKLSDMNARNHHSLPLTNYDASSLAAVSLSPSLGLRFGRRSMGSTTTTTEATGAAELLLTRGQQTASVCSAADVATASVSSIFDPTVTNMTSLAAKQCDNQAPAIANNNDESFDSDDDDDNSSAASSTTSSGIHGGGTSLSSASSSASSNLGSSSTSSTGSVDQSRHGPSSVGIDSNTSRPFVNSAEQLSEKIRRTVMEHNHLQSLLVNIIRQHDLQRELQNQQRRQQQQHNGFDGSATRNFSDILINGSSNNNMSVSNANKVQRRIDLAEIADALDDGCLCHCHSEPTAKQQMPDDVEDEASAACAATLQDGSGRQSNVKRGRASTLPAPLSKQQEKNAAGNTTTNHVSSRKARRLKKLRGNQSNSNELNRQDIINLLADKLCESCYETHYWLHGCSIELLQPKSSRQDSESRSSSLHQQQQASSLNNQQRPQNVLQQQQQISQLQLEQQQQDLNGVISRRNATFIKLVQQQVRSTISKSIELIDLIRKEIKSPESIKQKQLMRCFSTSIQLLTSVGNYVVPAQDISSFIPEVDQQQTTLFCLPPSDFDHLLLYPPSCPVNSNNIHLHNQQQTTTTTTSGNQSNYHLASAPEIPIRRRVAAAANELKQIDGHGGGTVSSQNKLNQDNKSQEQKLSSNLLRLKTSDSLAAPAVVDSSSGASSNNSSASSSIARGAVQQSSLTRAQTSSAILDGKTRHDLSFEAIASLSGQQTEDDMMYGQARPKFWQSSKFNFIKKLLHVKQQRLLRQQSKDRRIYNNKVQNKFRLVMMDLTHFNKSQQLLTTENGVNSLLTSMRNVLEFGLYLTLKLY